MPCPVVVSPAQWWYGLQSVGIACPVLVCPAQWWCDLPSVGMACPVLVCPAQCWYALPSCGITCPVVVWLTQCWYSLLSVSMPCPVLIWPAQYKIWYALHVQNLSLVVRKVARNRWNSSESCNYVLVTAAPMVLHGSGCTVIILRLLLHCNYFTVTSAW